MAKLFYRVGEFVGSAQLALAKAIIAIRPVQSKKPKINKFTWQDFVDVLKPMHYVYVAIGIAGVFSLSYLLTSLPILELSIVGSIELVIQIVLRLFGITTDIKSYSTPAIFLLLVLWRDQVGSLYGVGPINLVSGLPWFAMREELAFRAGCETWTFVEKVRGCLTFGLMHITMLIVPIGTALSLSFGGAVFMFVYLHNYKRTGSQKKAAKESATAHTLYNAMLLATLVILVVYAIV